MRKRRTTLIVLTGLVLLSPPLPAQADPPVGITQECDTDGCNNTIYGDEPRAGGGGNAPCRVSLNNVFLAPAGTVIPCSRTLDGITTKWSSFYQCYWQPVQNLTVNDQSFTMEEYAEIMGRPGRVAAECVQTWDGARIDFELGGRGEFWVNAGGVDPAVLARRAVTQMQLRAPQIGMTGGSPPDGMQIVGIPAWMWVADPGESTTGPIERFASEGGITVRATARLDRTVWTMGDGTVVTCPGARAPGTPYEGRYDKLPSPTCGHMYTRTSAGQPNEAFTVIVTAYWVVEWSVVAGGGGQSGTITQQMSRNTPKQVGELQALLVSPGSRR